MESSRKTNTNHFSAQRNKIKIFFENQPLINSVKEFYERQKEFHQKMANVVKAFKNIQAQLDSERRYLLNDLLAPYKVLAIYPFAGPSGDIEADILDIIKVINRQNKDFTDALFALFETVSNIETFNQLLEEFKRNPAIVNALKEQFNSWLEVQSAVDHPFQNLMRYPLLLNSIKDKLGRLEAEHFQLMQREKADIGVQTEELPEILSNASQTNLEATTMASVVLQQRTDNNNVSEIEDDEAIPYVSKDAVEQSLGYILPEITNINENREVMLMLNKILRILGDLLADEILKEEKSEMLQATCSDLRQHIEMAMIATKKGKTQIIQEGNKKLMIMLEGLHEMLLQLHKVYQEQKNVQDQSGRTFSIYAAANYAANKSYSFLTFPVSFFGYAKEAKNYWQDLAEVTNEIKEFLDQVNAFKNIYRLKRQAH